MNILRFKHSEEAACASNHASASGPNVGSEANVTSNEVIKTIFQDVKPDHTCWGTQFSESPEQANASWGGEAFLPSTNNDWDPNCNTYISQASFPPGATNRTKESADRVHCFVLDDIGTKTPESALDDLPPPNLRIETSPGSFQVGWGFENPISVSDAEYLLKLRKQAGIGDDSGNNPVRYFRLPEGINNKSTACDSDGNPWQVKCKHWDPTNLTKYDDLKKALEAVAHKKAAAIQSSSAEANALHNADQQTATDPIDGLPEGIRNQAIFKLACSLRGKGLSKKQAKPVVLQAAANCTPPLPEDEALKCLKSAWKYWPRDPLNDLGNGDRFATLHAGEYRYIVETGVWLKRVGDVYVEGPPSEMITAARAVIDLLNAAARNAKDETASKTLHAFARKTGDSARLKAMLEAASKHHDIELPISQVDTDPYVAGVSGSVIDLRTGKLTSGTGIITKQLGASYDPSAACSRFTEFLVEIFDDKEDLVRYVQRLSGYLLTGSTEEHAVFWFFGPGANGKSVLLNILQSVMGDYAVHLPADALRLSSNPNRFALSQLPGARMVRVSEIGPSFRLNQSLLNDLTGGDPVTAEIKFKAQFQFKMTGKLLCATNSLPKIAGTEHGIWRRQIVIPMNNIIPPEKQDKGLEHYIRENELSGVLNWMLRGLEEYLAMGLSPPPEISDLVSEYRHEQDPFEEWFRACCQVKEAGKSKASSLYRAYKLFADAAGETPRSQKELGQWLKHRKQLKSVKKQCIYYMGVELLGQKTTPT